MSHGCYNRGEYETEIVLYGVSRDTGLPVKTVIPQRMTRECQYQKDDRYADKGCDGCKHKEER